MFLCSSFIDASLRFLLLLLRPFSSHGGLIFVLETRITKEQTTDGFLFFFLLLIEDGKSSDVMAEASPVLKGRNSGGSSRIPRLQRSASFHGEAKKFSRTQHDVTEEDLTEALDDLGSLSSVCSVASCATPSNAYRKAVETACDFRRGSLSSPRYALHCTTSSTTSNGGIGEYLTPTQRANRTIRQLK